SPQDFNPYAERIGTAPVQQSTPLRQLIKRPEVRLAGILEITGVHNGYKDDELVHAEFVSKYRGYLKREQELAEKFRKMENLEIPENIDYESIPSLSSESREKLQQIRPVSLGQVSRISGVRQGDLAILLVFLEKYARRSYNVSRETD
ncbi:MAG: tRNA uridine-5-carboxymethylaminomethyl(34) synthesis enzyme MnmG, partial [Calditrichaeota bacterium]